VQDVIELHQRVLAHFARERANIPVYQNRIRTLKWLRDRLDDGQRFLYDQDIALYMTRIRRIEQCIDEATYLCQTAPLLQRYEKIVNRPVTIPLTMTQNQHCRQQANYDRCVRAKIAKEFIRIATPFLQMMSVDQADYRSSADRTLLSADVSNPGDGQQQSPHSNVQSSHGILSTDDVPASSQQEQKSEKNDHFQPANVRTLDDRHAYRDRDRTTSSTSYKYDLVNNFRCCLRKLQGKEQTVIPDEVWKCLRLEIHRYQIAPETIELSTLRQFMIRHELDAFLDDIYLIHSQFTGKPCIDLSEYEDRLIAHYRQYLQAYRKVHRDMRLKRCNAIDRHYILCKLLQLLDAPFSMDDIIVTTKTPRILRGYDCIWERVCKECDWPFVATHR
jgi:hypothetical protein